jgi:C-terminal processing protease CtpA/Prc
MVFSSALILLSSCGSNSSYIDEPFPLASNDKINNRQYFRVRSPVVCNQENRNRFIYQVMHDSYLWATDVPELDYTQYKSDKIILDTLKSREDHFSFIVDKQEATDYFEKGENSNFGFSIELTSLNKEHYALVITFVYPNSPADRAGFKRGQIITQVENQPLIQENIDKIIANLEDKKSITFTFSKGNTTYNKRISKERYEINPILYTNSFIDSNGDHKIGYMVFQDFIDSAKEKLDNLFWEFKRDKIDELILDLRYNGGGSVDIANHLASLIGGSNVSENIFHYVSLNERYSKYNFHSYFEKENSNALNLNRVFILTTRASCSASELLINALRASINNIEVVQIGEATCGKPYGFMGSGSFCEKSLFAINMETKNSDGIGGYTQGILPTCSLKDDIFKDFGDPKEALLKEALFFISKNECSKEEKREEKPHRKDLSRELKREGFKRIMPAF